MAEDDVGQVREALGDHLAQGLLVLDDDARPVLAGVLPHPAPHGGAAVAGVVVGGDDESGVEQGRDEVDVAAGVLPQAVDDLDGAARGGGGDVDPGLDLVAAVGGGEGDLVQCHG